MHADVGYAYPVLANPAVRTLEGTLGGTLGVIWRTTMSDSVDQHLRGRVNSLDAIGSLIFIPLAPVLGGG